MWYTEKQVEGQVKLLGGAPRILMSPEVYSDIRLMVDEHPQELGWLGSVSRNGDEFTINEVFLIAQTAESASCELSPSGQADVAMDLFTNRPDAEQIFNSLFLWGHSHVNFSVEPSMQDDSQLGDLAAKSSEAYFLRLITNKQGKMNFTIQINNQGLEIQILNVPWSVVAPAVDESRRLKWREEIAAKVVRFFPKIPGIKHHQPPIELPLKRRRGLF